MSKEASQTSQSHTPSVSHSEKRLEILATILLSFAAVASAWSGFQASLWNGVQSSNYSQASALRTKATQSHLEANQDQIFNVNLLDGYFNADASGQIALRDFYRSRFRGELAKALDAWSALQPQVNPSAPRSPLRMPEYQLPAEDQANALDAQADAKFLYGEHANATSDTYVATTLFFASVLFFAAISERFEFRTARIILLTLAGVSLCAGLYIAITQRVTWG